MIWWKKVYVHRQKRSNEILYRVTARRTESGHFRELFVRRLISLDSWHYILFFRSWLHSNILFFVSQLMKLRSIECKSLIQIILIINTSFEKLQKQVGPRVGISFRCNSYETPLSSRNIDEAIPEIFISSGREWTIHFLSSWANWSRKLFFREREKLNDRSC